ncbi:hypothetical protein EC973_006481 [Apophysomyces ossiformis]|uniref:Enoyl reductase (ER) domain-containing protein n=1 Tax=Apophysomyces ossiformis TaxID=679940 RepID=A0A8H7BJN1_9FUNG|nr:hypothetical protein EC973_006481 [Apophysomyces ossiformis]
MVKNEQVIFVKYPTAYPVVGEHLQLKESSIDLESVLSEGDVILKNLAFSIDPYLRLRMIDPSTGLTYFNAYPLNQPLVGNAISKVLRSSNPKFKAGDIVYGTGAFEEYSHINADSAEQWEVRNYIKERTLPFTNYLGVLGLPGLTAYVGLLKFGEPKKGETLFVSAAAGAVGQLVGQLGKILGLRVVGSAGSDEKIAYLKEIGFDAAFNYKTESVDEALTKHCPNGVDIYYDNVGGKMLEHVLKHASYNGRIVVCGAITSYNGEEPEGIRNTELILYKKLKVQAFNVWDHWDLGEFTQRVTAWLIEGKIKYREVIVEGLGQTGQALLDVLKGQSQGKQIVKIADL